MVFLSYYFLICFKGLLRVKLILKSVLEKLNTLRSCEKRDEKNKKVERDKNSARNAKVIWVLPPT